MKLNNKGFAITGILYTLLILFSLILVSVLAGLSTRKRIMEKSVESMGWEKIEDNITNSNDTKIAAETGKYQFIGDNSLICYSYLKKGVTITDKEESFNYTTKECNDLKSTEDSLEYTGIYYIPNK